MRILFTRTDTGWQQIGSRIIRAFEGGVASHCGVLIPDGAVIDASWPKGVQASPRKKWMAGRTLVAEIDVPVPREAIALAWLSEQAGQRRGYDVLEMLGFLLWRGLGARTSFVCSSLILAAMCGLLLTEAFYAGLSAVFPQIGS